MLLSCLSFTLRFMNFISWLVRTLHSCLMILWQLPFRATEFRLILTSKLFLEGWSLRLLIHLKILVVYTTWLRLFFSNIAETFSCALTRRLINGVCVSLLILFLYCIMCNWRRKIRIDSVTVSITWLSSCSSSGTVTDWISNYIWLDWCQSLHKLLETNFCVSVKIKSPHDCNKLFFDWAMANLFQESPYCLLINISEIQRINCFKCSTNAEFLELL